MMTLYDFAYCGRLFNALRVLEQLVPEKWSFADKKDLSILKNYVLHTFLRVYEEKKVVESDNYAIFNTGLFDTYYKPVYAYFIPNEHKDMQKWFLDGFVTEYQLVNMGITDMPERANYFDNPSDLVFDTRLDIVAQYDHIFEDEDNIKRLPLSVRDSSMKVSLFNGALDVTKRMLEANYKVAVPQYYKGKIQLLVPICLQNPNVPDLALACSKTEDGLKYLGCTCLTLEMAYNNARLIAKPESNWLHS